MRVRSESQLLQAALLIGSAIGAGQLGGLFLPAQAQTGSGLQQNKLEQEQLRERLDRRQRELQKPVPLTQPGQAPVSEPGSPEQPRTDQSRCDPGLFRVNRITVVDGSQQVLALDCHAPGEGFFTTSVEPNTLAVRRRGGGSEFSLHLPDQHLQAVQSVARAPTDSAPSVVGGWPGRATRSRRHAAATRS